MSVSTFHHNFEGDDLHLAPPVPEERAPVQGLEPDGAGRAERQYRRQPGRLRESSQFSREFKRYFGRTPSEEVQAARR
ncbi:helix-turn-helix transcriptional regulator [Pseudomonas aeruginosa]|nr:helix-turn-helix transcriptional regulator [Pseudomonas aeruginosa]